MKTTKARAATKSEIQSWAIEIVRIARRGAEHSDSVFRRAPASWRAEVDATPWKLAGVARPATRTAVAAVAKIACRTCKRCRKEPVTTIDPETKLCHGCWYGDQLDAAGDRFAPVRRALEAHGVDAGRIDVWQMGGMVMCLAVIGRFDDANKALQYVLFSEPESAGGFAEDDFAFGVYDEIAKPEDEGTMVMKTSKDETLESVTARAVEALKNLGCSLGPRS